MKKHHVFTLMATVLLLCGCTKTDAPPETSAPPVTMVTAEQAKYPLSIDAWQTEPEYLNCKEYFSEDRTYTANGNAWLKFDGNKGSRYYLKTCEDGLAVTEEATQKMCLIPDSAQYTDAQILCADGNTAHLYKDNTVYRLELDSGRTEAIFSGQFVQSTDNIAISGNAVFHYATYENGMLKIGRLYLPDGTNDLLFQEKCDVYNFWLFLPDSTTEDITWTMLRQEFVDAVKNAWENPESPYKTGNNYDLSDMWGSEEGLHSIFDSPMILLELQEALGERALMEYTYHSDASVSHRIGEMDSCYAGSDKMHDHFAPDTNTVPQIEVAIGGWQAGAASFPLATDGPFSSEVFLYTYADNAGSQYLYKAENYIYTKLVDEPIIGATDTGTCFVYWTQDGRVTAVSHDGQQTALLYTAARTGIRSISCCSLDPKSLCIVDGNTVIEYDLVNVRYRTLLTHDYLISAAFHISDDGTAKNLYFFIRNGMYVGQFLLHMDTEELEQVFWL